MPLGITDAPRPYRDELHFGYFGRLQTYWLTATANDLARHLRGGTKGHASGDLLGLSDDLVRCLTETGIEAERLLWQNTLLPYYLAFQTDDERTRVLGVIGTGNLMGLHFRMGIGSCCVKHPRYFRYCPACWHSEVAELGEVYVKRLFQLPGVLVCPEHNESLCNTTILYRPLASRAYRNFTRADATHDRVFTPKSGHEEELARLLAFDARRLLLQGASVHPRAGCLSPDYHRALQHLGLASRNAHPLELESAFLDMYPMRFLEQLELGFEPRCASNWLRRLVRKSSTRFHPLQHILFRRFVERQLGSDCWECMEAERWPCLSPLVPHPGAVAVRVCCLHFDAQRNAWDGIFECDCGFRYSGGGEGYPTAHHLHLHRVIFHSPHLHRRVAELAGAGCSVSAIARQLKLHRKTVKGWLGKSDSEKPGKMAMLADREAWLTLMRQNPHSGRLRLRQQASALYSRLRAHDAAWLKELPVPRQHHQSGRHAGYWSLRDQALSVEVQKLLNEIEGRKPAVRVTVSRVGRELGIVNLLRQELARMPLTAEILSQCVETVEAFQFRRLEAALDERSGNQRLSQHLRAAGLRHERVRPAVAAAMARLLMKEGVN